MDDFEMPKCFCGRGVRLWSSLLEQGFCSDEHYEDKTGTNAATKFRYVAHGVYQSTEEQ